MRLQLLRWRNKVVKYRILTLTSEKFFSEIQLSPEIIKRVLSVL